MARILSGPGLIESSFDDTAVFARLFNFDTDGHEPKSEHKRWLEHELIPVIPNAEVIIIYGLASRLGNGKYNEQLATRRMNAVVEFLKQNGISEKKIFGESWGERNAFGLMEDDKYDRAVLIIAQKKMTQVTPSLPKPQPPHLVPKPPRPQPGKEMPRPVATLHFRIRLVSAVTTKWSMTGIFEIEDKVNFDRQTYEFKGIGLPFLPGIPYGISTAGDWNEFSTSFAATVKDFSGSMDFESYYFPPPKIPPGAPPIIDRTIVVLKCSQGMFKWNPFKGGKTHSAFSISFYKGDFDRRMPVMINP